MQIYEQCDGGMQGKAGSRDPIKAEELILALINHDLFVYFGHGSGMSYIHVIIVFVPFSLDICVSIVPDT
jgi:hypothetical protein